MYFNIIPSELQSNINLPKKWFKNFSFSTQIKVKLNCLTEKPF